MRRVLRIAGSLGLSLTAAVGVVFAAESHEGAGPAAYPSSMNKKFTAPKVDVGQFVKRFENDSRDVYVEREAIVRAIGLRPGQAVADIGAGTGLFTMLFAKEVGNEGTVYAVDISPAFVKFLGQRAREEGYQEIVKPVLNSQDSTDLPPGSIDVAFLCDTYHHMEHPEKMLASIHQALRPGGRLVLVDFDLREGASEFVRHRARATKEVYSAELAKAGFEQVENKNAPKLNENFYAAFRRVER